MGTLCGNTSLSGVVLTAGSRKKDPRSRKERTKRGAQNGVVTERCAFGLYIPSALKRAQDGIRQEERRREEVQRPFVSSRQQFAQ